MPRRLLPACLSLVLIACGSKESRRDAPALRLATTTSVTDSGLLGVLVPAFEKQTGSRVTVRAVGSGRALELLAAGEVDVAITHTPEAELDALRAGRIGARTPIMRNDFVIVGPKDAVSVVAGASDASDAMRAIASSGNKFVSRGDRSGTHQRERALWLRAGVASTDHVVSANGGMKATLARASKQRAFTLTDRATFLAHRGSLELAIVFQGDDDLANVYSILEPPTTTTPAPAQRFVAYLRGPEARRLIGRFGVDFAGEPLFTPAD